MILPIANLIDATLLADAQKLGSQDALFTDGAATAGWHARQRKQNLQAGADRQVTRLLGGVEKILLAHALVQAAARPASVIRMLLSRYDRGMHYGPHVDDAVMQGSRTDLSFTLFLTPPDQYEGGALVIEETDGEKSFRLEAGSMLLYPSTTLHRVEPVTRGSRLAVVGWIRSQVRSGADREILFDLEQAIHQIRQIPGTDSGRALTLLLRARSNLLRRWVE